jgi:hypothetical protein
VTDTLVIGASQCRLLHEPLDRHGMYTAFLPGTYIEDLWRDLDVQDRLSEKEYRVCTHRVQCSTVVNLNLEILIYSLIVTVYGTP